MCFFFTAVQQLMVISINENHSDESSCDKVLVLFLQVFDSEGSFLSFVNTSGNPLYGPQGLAFTEDGNILVADSGNHCFKVYRHLL